MPVEVTTRRDGVTDDMVDFIVKSIAVVVVTAEEGTTKAQLAKSIHQTIKEEWGHNGWWNVIVASTPEGEDGDDVWGSMVTTVEKKYLKLQLGDALFCEIWKSHN